MKRQAPKLGSLGVVLVMCVASFASASEDLCDRWAEESVSRNLIQSCRSGDDQARYSMLLNEIERSGSDEEKTNLSWLRMDMLVRAEILGKTLDTVSAYALLSRAPRSQRADRNFLAWKIRNRAVQALEKQVPRNRIKITQVSDRALANLRFAAGQDHPEATFEMARRNLSLGSKSDPLKAQQLMDKAISLGFEVPAVFKLELRSALEGSTVSKEDLIRAKQICGRWSRTQHLSVHSEQCYELDWLSRYELIKNSAAAQTAESDKQPYFWEMVLLRVQAHEDNVVLDSSVSTLDIMDLVMRDGDPEKQFVFYQLNKASAVTDPDVLDSLRRAADDYYADANKELARLYFTGEAGLPKDMELAKKYMQRSKLSSDTELAELDQGIKEEKEQADAQERKQLEIIAARNRRLLTGTLDPVCDRWTRSDVTRRLTDQCKSLTIHQQYALLMDAVYSPGSYENKQVLHWERAQMLLEAEQKGIDLDSASASQALGMVNKNQDAEMYFVSWLANKNNNRSRAHQSLKLAAEYQHPKAYYELARLTLSGGVSQKELDQTIEYLDEAQALGFEVPKEFINRIEVEKTRLLKLEQQRLAEEEKAKQEKAKRVLELAQLQVPDIDIDIMDEALHKHLRYTLTVGDSALGPALGFAPGVTYSCDSTYCYALGGIVKFRYDVESVSSCRYDSKIYADCRFKFRLNQDSEMELGQWRSELLRGLTSAKQLSGYASMKFSDSDWRITSFRGN